MREYTNLVQLFEINNVTLVLVFVCTFFAVFWSTKRHKGVPPGPPCWPFIGYIGSLIGGNVLTNLRDLRKRYGDVYGIYIGSELNVFLNGYGVIHDALVKKGRVFSHRPVFLSSITPAVVFANGTDWKTHRVSVSKMMYDLFLANRGENLSTIISKELEYLAKIIDDANGQAMYPFQHLNIYTASIMYQICYGKHIEPNDSSFLWYLDILDRAFTAFTRRELKLKLFNSSYLKYLPGDFLELKSSAEEHALLEPYFAEVTRPNRERLQLVNDGEETCLTDKLWNKDCTIEADMKWRILHEMMAAGTETTATTLGWFLLFISQNPSCQEVLYKDVIRVKGKSEQVSLTDRDILPSIEAAILETLRLSTPTPLSVTHATAEDVTFAGYFIPKGTKIHPNLSSAHFDKDIFPDPMNFNPDRFLSDDKQSVVNANRVVSFSMGPRSCLGETIARAELFMTIVGILQRYKVSTAGKPPSTAGVFGLTYRPQPFEVVFTKRMDD